VYNRRHGSRLLIKQLREPEREFEAATRRSDVGAAAKELQRRKAASPSALEVCSWLTSRLLRRTRGRPQCDREPDVVPLSISSCVGPCVWHVVGLQRSVQEWAIRQGWGDPVRQEQAQGILVAALGMLVGSSGHVSIDRLRRERG
jgi:hypothetical protein